MNRIVSSLIMLALSGGMAHVSADENPVVPAPVATVSLGDASFELKEKMTICCDEAAEPQARYLCDLLQASTGYSLKVAVGARKGSVRLRVDSLAADKAEGYHLRVTAKGVEITGHDAAGVFYGIQTLLQYFPAEVYSDRLQRGVRWSVPAVDITDAPDHPWRGMMLDAARYYYDKSFVLRFIDMMAMYKLNKLQFHFIDDSGWRLEIKKYPRLTEVGAWAGTAQNRIGGYYTQDDIREMVAYAKVRGVEIIPEIEFPTHILSAVVAYPWLSCTGLQHEVPLQHFISRDLLCVGKQSSLQFLRDVLDETVSLFPSRYINIGGDEAVYSRWEQCSDCQALMRHEGLSKVSGLQGWLTNQVAGWMKEKGRTVIGWEEIIMRGEVTTPVVALAWHNVDDTIKATNGGHKAILTPCTNLYFDFPESSTPGEPKHATWMPPISLKKAYTMPLNDYSAASTTLGVQGCIWSDQFIHGDILREILPIDEDRSERYVEYLCMPRMAALSELGWCRRAQRNYSDFKRRMKNQYPRLDVRGWGYRVPEPQVASETVNSDGTVSVTLANPVAGAVVRYTTDGTWPTVHSKVYNGETITVKQRADLLAITEVTPTHYSLPLYTAPDYSAYKQYGTFLSDWQPLRVQPISQPWRMDCTGKISGNGRYEITFVQRRGANSLHLGNVRLFKRDEQIASLSQSADTSDKVTCSFSVDCFEAGTPFVLEVDAYGDGGNDTAGLVFIRKVE